ncbi:type II toxin-antitoxin system PemK/MazF family toxin [Anaerotignum sp.]
MKSNSKINPIVKQYELWLGNLPASEGSHVQRGYRPVLIVSNDAANTNSPVVTVVPLTSKLNKQHLPTHVFLQEQGLDKNSIALCEQIITLDKSQLLRRIGYIYKSFDRLAIYYALAIQLGMAA